MAKLEHTLDAGKYSGLDANLKTLYLQQGDKYVLDVDNTPAATALEAERTAKKALEARLAGYGDLTPEQVKELASQKSKAEREKDLASGNFEKILAEERAKHAKDMELRDGNEKSLMATLESALIGEEATRALTEHDGNPDLLLPIIKGRAKLEKVNGRMVAVVIGENGGPLLKAGAQKADDYMPIRDYVASVLKPDKRYAGAFTSRAGSGSGGPRRTTQVTPETQQEAQRMQRTVDALKAGAKRVGVDG